MQLSAIKESDLEILTNKEIIAINQDPVVGTSISPFRWGVNVRGSFFVTIEALRITLISFYLASK